MAADALPGLAQPRQAPATTCRALVPVQPGTCPLCGAPTSLSRADQDALFRHGGYGATRTSVVRHCAPCAWSLIESTGETRPPTEEG